MSDRGLFLLAAAATHLRELWIEQPLGLVSDATAQAIAAHCPCLETLALKDCSWPTDDAVDGRRASVAHANMLARVHDAPVRVRARAGGGRVAVITGACHRLRELHVGGNSLTTTAVELVATRCGPSLEVFTLDGRSLFQRIHMTDALLLQLLDGCPRLVSLTACEMSFVGTAVAVRALARRSCVFRIGAWTVVDEGGLIRSDELSK